MSVFLFYFDEPVQPVSEVENGWVQCEWLNDGRTFKHRVEDLKAIPATKWANTQAEKWLREAKRVV